MKQNKVFLIIGFGLIVVLFGLYFGMSRTENSNNEKDSLPTFTEVSVHDPSIIKDGDAFYTFGSHLAAAKTKDLMN